MRIGMTEDGRHWIEATDPPTRVYHCHYCGEKLERPDVKIEVSRLKLEEIAMELWRARKLLSQRTPLAILSSGAQFADVEELIDAILRKGIIDD